MASEPTGPYDSGEEVAGHSASRRREGATGIRVCPTASVVGASSPCRSPSVVVDSSERTIDTFLITNYYAGYYVVVSKNTDTGESSIHQVTLIHDGSSNAYLNVDPSITTSGGTNQLNFSQLNQKT